MSTSTIRVTLPEEFSPDDRAYFYQSLSAINYFLLPGTEILLNVSSDEREHEEAPLEEKLHYQLEIQFNNSTIKASIFSASYHDAVKSMMSTLEAKFSDILKTVARKEAKKVQADSDSEDDKKVIH